MQTFGQPIDIEKFREQTIKLLRDMQRMVTFENSGDLKTRRIKEIQDALAHHSLFTIHTDYSDVKMVSIDKYNRVKKTDNLLVSLYKAMYAYDQAVAVYYDIKRGNLPGNIDRAARKVITAETTLSSVEKEEYNERSCYAIRTMIAEMLLSRQLKGTIIFGAADSKYFLEETRRVNEDPQNFLNHLKKDNETTYQKVLSAYSLEDLKQLSIELYMVMPKAFRPYE